jgi:hypothetical protein
MPHNDHGRHANNKRRPIEHRVAGGNHRDRSGCFAVMILLLVVPFGILAAGAGFAARIVL